MRELLRRRPGLAIGFAAVLLLALIVWAVFLLGRPLPPRRIVMTTGPEGGAFREFGEKYRAALARERIDLKLVPSLGNVENLSRLKDPASGVSAGFVSGGLTTARESPGIVSLGTISCDPIWIFCRNLPEPVTLGNLRGKRVSIGPEGGGTRPLMLELLRASEMERDLTALPLTPGAGGEALLRGEIDCACMLTAFDAPIVRKLLADERVSLVTFPRADALVALYPYLRKVEAPRGVGRLAKDRPPQDVTLLAPMTSLLVREDLHPAIQFLLMQAAEEIHSGPGLFSTPGQFPAPEPVDVPLSSEARPFYKSGGSFLQRRLPFWLWVLSTRLLLVLIPLAGIAYPLLRVVPALLDVVVDWRIQRLYRELRRIEKLHRSGGGDAAQAARDLERFEAKVDQTRISPSGTAKVYTLRHHIGLVRERLARGPAGADPGGEPPAGG